MRWHSAGRSPAASRGQHVGQLVERRLAGEQRVERGVAQQVQGERQPVGEAAAAAPGRRDRADLAAADASAGRSGTRPPSGRLTSRSPYQLSSRTVPSGASRSSDALQPGGGGAGVHDEVPARRRRRPARRTSTPSAAATAARAGIDVDQLHPDAGEPGQQRGDAAADHARADHGDPVADQRRGVPERVHRGLHGAGQHRPRGRHPVRHRRPPRRPAPRTRSGAGRGRRRSGPTQLGRARARPRRR